MAKALFVVPFRIGTTSVYGTALLPNLYEYVNGNIRDGCGWTCIGNVPQSDSCIVLVDSSVATITAMRNSPDYIFLEDIIDAEA